MTRLILHLGFAKTGTTSLQTSLAASRDALAERGVLYPDAPFGDLHIMLIPYLLGLEATPAYVHQKYPDRKALEQGAEVFWDAIVSRIRKTSPHTLVLSSEHLGDLTRHPKFPHAVAKLSALASETHIVAYVRSPVGMYASYAQEKLKSGEKPFRPDQMISAKDRIAPLTETPGITPHILPFDRSSLIGQDIRIDFATRFLPEGAVDVLDRESTDWNESISAEAMAVLECYVDDIFPDGFRRQGDMSYHRRLRLARLDRDLPGFASPSYLPGVTWEIYRVARDLDWLAENFGVKFKAPEASAPGDVSSRTPASEMTRVRDYCVVDEQRFLSLLRVFQSPPPDNRKAARPKLSQILRFLRFRKPRGGKKS